MKIMASSPITSWQIEGGNVETMADFIFVDSQITADGDCRQEINRHSLLSRKAMANLGSILKSRDITLLTKVHLVKAMVFPVAMYGCERWTINKAEHQRTDIFKLWCWKILKFPLDCKKIQPVNPKGNQPWIFTGRTDVELPILWPSDVKSWLIGKDPDSGKDRRQKEKGAAESKMVGWHHWHNGHEFELTSMTVKDKESWCVVVLCGIPKCQIQLNDWITDNNK